MARLLEAQKEAFANAEDSYLMEFAEYLFDKMLEVHFGELTGMELREIEDIVKDWRKSNG